MYLFSGGFPLASGVLNLVGYCGRLSVSEVNSGHVFTLGRLCCCPLGLVPRKVWQTDRQIVTGKQQSCVVFLGLSSLVRGLTLLSLQQADHQGKQQTQRLTMVPVHMHELILWEPTLCFW